MLKRGFLKVRGIRRKVGGLKRSVSSKKVSRRRVISKHGKSHVSVVKRQIQAVLRENAIKRDKTCVVGQYLSSLPENWRICGPLRKDGEIILQAEHLCGRAKSVSYADMDNILLVCMRHHFYFKTQKPLNYWSIVRFHLGEERWSKVQAWESDNTLHKYSADEWRSKLEQLKNYGKA